MRSECALGLGRRRNEGAGRFGSRSWYLVRRHEVGDFLHRDRLARTEVDDVLVERRVLQRERQPARDVVHVDKITEVLARALDRQWLVCSGLCGEHTGHDGVCACVRETTRQRATHSRIKDCNRLVLPATCTYPSMAGAVRTP